MENDQLGEEEWVWKETPGEEVVSRAVERANRLVADVLDGVGLAKVSPLHGQRWRSEQYVNHECERLEKARDEAVSIGVTSIAGMFASFYMRFMYLRRARAAVCGVAAVASVVFAVDLGRTRQALEERFTLAAAVDPGRMRAIVAEVNNASMLPWTKLEPFE